ncbi:MAG: 2OG-Fe(II) oxygenase [Pseudomonadales bacterium]|nr:2OG-Fe(II) oxygenase [Pseudomonadales bacterium]
MTESSPLFNNICSDLYQQGYSIQKHSLSETLAQGLYQHISNLDDSRLKKAGIGRNADHQQQDDIRRDKILWIEGENEIERQWLNWLEDLKQCLNRQLFLGLFSLESHFAIYRPGDFYKKHLDVFQGKSNRKLSVVTYLNPDWPEDAGGELVLFDKPENHMPWQDSHELCKVVPQMATTVIFLSEDFPHEVLPAQQRRYSIASWFRVNHV